MQSMPSSSNNGKFDLRVAIKYKGLKATTYFSKFTPESEEVLRRDLATLRIPLPKVGNVVFLSHGSLQFFWPGLGRDNILRKGVLNRINPHDVESQLEMETLFEDLSILSMSMQPNHSEYKVPRTKAKRPYPFAPTSENSSTFSEPEPYSDSQVLHPKYRRPLPFGASPNTETRSASSEAERFLDDIKSTLPPPTKRVKLEPVEETIPGLTSAFESNNSKPPVTKALPTKPTLLRQRYPLPDKPADAPVDQTSSTSPVTGLALQPQGKIPLPANTPPDNPNRKTPNEKANAQLLAQAQAIIAAFPPTNMPRLTDHAPSQYHSAAHSGKTNLNVDTKSIISQSISHLSNTTRSPNDATTIQQLTEELWQIRQQLNITISRESEIIAELKRLQSTSIPEPSRIVTSDEDHALKARLEQVEAELEIERSLRLEAEKTLEDIGKERASPFIVPALLDAFKVISQLTSKVSMLQSES